jgi:hypothetical protein
MFTVGSTGQAEAVKYGISTWVMCEVMLTTELF